MSSAFGTDLVNRLLAQGTGSRSAASIARVMVVELDQYEVVIALTEDDKVVGVVEVRVKKDFRNIQQRIGSTGYIDVNQFVK
jgi:SepF-like predicted cell division protein (DUF552 family)